MEHFPELKRTYIDTGKVRYILREFPIGKTSGMATIALRCAPPDKYLDALRQVHGAAAVLGVAGSAARTQFLPSHNRWG